MKKWYFACAFLCIILAFLGQGTGQAIAERNRIKFYYHKAEPNTFACAWRQFPGEGVELIVKMLWLRAGCDSFSFLGSAKQLLLWGPIDVIVSNPPYVFHEDMASLDAEILR